MMPAFEYTRMRNAGLWMASDIHHATARQRDVIRHES
jgi:hypothetical protein